MSNRTIGLLLALVGLLLAGAGVVVSRSGSVIFGVLCILLGILAVLYGLFAGFPAISVMLAKRKRARRHRATKEEIYPLVDLEPILEDSPDTGDASSAGSSRSAVAAPVRPASARDTAVHPAPVQKHPTSLPVKPAPASTGFTISLPKFGTSDTDASMEELSSAVGYKPNVSERPAPSAPTRNEDAELEAAMAAAQAVAAKFAAEPAEEAPAQETAPQIVEEETAVSEISEPSEPVVETQASEEAAHAPETDAAADVDAQAPVAIPSDDAPTVEEEPQDATPSPLQQLAALANSLPATAQAAPDGADLEACHWAKTALEKAGCDTALLGFGSVGGCLTINCIVPVLRLKPKARKPYLIVKEKARLPKGCETGPCAKSEGAGNIRVFYGDMAGLAAFARLLKRNYDAAQKAVAEQISDNEKAMQSAAEVLSKQYRL